MKYLIDNSAFAHIAHPAVGAALGERVEAGRVSICGVLALEAGVSARNGAEHKALAAWLGALPRVPLTDEDFSRASQVQGQLAGRGKHRSALLPDLLVAACAERHGLVVLHYDHDFDVVAEVTHQPVEWVVPPGTIS